MNWTPPLPAPRTEPATFVSFDGGVSEATFCQRPDRYRLIEADLGDRPRIARGGGYSYAAASFGAGSIVQDLRHFHRVLRFDPLTPVIEVEAGATLGDVLGLTSRAGLVLPVQPGYPAITVGGCIAANVHGKNPVREGTFFDSVLDLTLFHPRYGVVRVGREDPSGVFDLTCGGYGLTGVILAASLRLDPLLGDTVSIRRFCVGHLAEAIALAQELAGESLFAYSWHDAAPRSQTFGRGFVYQGVMIPRSQNLADIVPRYRILTPTGRSRIPFSIWGPLTTRACASAFWHIERSRPARTQASLFDAMFPFARRALYFRLFGRPGLAEYQVLVPHDRTQAFLNDLRRLILSTRAPSVMLSLKAFGGAQRLLRFEGNGLCITLHLQRSTAALGLLRRLDELLVAVGGIPNIIKDSRVPRAVVRACYGGYEEFRGALRKFDAQRIFRSELSDRLGL